MRKKTLLVITFLGLGLAFITGCEQKTANDEANHSATHHEGEIKTSTPETSKATDSIGGVIEHYLHLKDALTKDDSKEAAAAGKALAESIASVDKSNFNEAEQKLYSEVAGDIKMHGEHISENDGNIAHQREHFDMLSNDIYDVVKTFGSTKKLYKIHCPMYNDKKGADWLSQEKKVKNPYYGKEMLTCGVVKEEIQ